MSSNSNSYLHTFEKDVSKLSKPKKFTFPFFYAPHDLVKLAAEQIQTYIAEHISVDFGYGAEATEESIGKMFGVLVVEDDKGQLGFLAAFSGRLLDSYIVEGFVPPLYDNVDPNSFYNEGERRVSQMTVELNRLEKEPSYLAALEEINAAVVTKKEAVKEAKATFNQARKSRRQERKLAQETLPEEEYTALHAEHIKISYHQQHQIKLLGQEWDSKIQTLESKVVARSNEIAKLKAQRKALSQQLQQQLFDQYQFLDANGDICSLIDVFKATAGQVPPSGAGDCAAPKLLQYAYQQQLKPLCMGEFWWGKETTAEVRKHGYFYPSCRGKCEPILGHMLQGLEVDKNPMLEHISATKELEVLYEDEALAIIIKPAEFLSVPGKSIDDCVYLRMKHRYPDATGPLIVHRLDMSTSGLMVIAKTKDNHKILQRQFIRKQVVKRYTALLDGMLHKKEGEIILPIRVDLNNRPRQLVCYIYGKMAHTRYEVVGEEEGRTRVHFYPITGRTHQLRVHAAHNSGLKTPIVGDDLYGKADQRLCLHAAYLKFTHPVSRKEVVFESSAPF